jgi:cytidylate kinase
VVFPEAEIKFFLDADPQIRAERRHAELNAKSGAQTSLEDVAEDMARRDRNDRSRTIAPLVAASDAVRIDSTRMSIDEVVDAMVDHIFAQHGNISSD